MVTQKRRKRKPNADRAKPLVQISRTSLRKLDQKSREQFGRYLHQMMKERGWSQSDLAAQLFGRNTLDNPDTGKKADNSAIGRDRISKYISGQSFPENDTLGKLCKIFKCEIDELLPPHVLSALEEIKSSAIDLQLIPGTDLCRCKLSGTYNLNFVKELVDLMERYDGERDRG